MNQINKLKILNDPIYGFISIPNPFIYDLIQHPYFQRLRRISQMGLSYLVYPGAHHTRFHHALGCMHIMQKAIEVIRFKGVSISEDEENALLVAILLHDSINFPFININIRCLLLYFFFLFDCGVYFILNSYMIYLFTIYILCIR